MLERMFLAFALLLMSAPAAAIKLSCGVEPDLTGPTYVELDTSTKTARILYPGFFGILDGRITLISKAGNGTDAYNFVFSNLPKPYEDQEWEFVLHRNSGEWTLFGAGYKTIDGVRHLASTQGQHKASCAASEA